MTAAKFQRLLDRAARLRARISALSARQSKLTAQLDAVKLQITAHAATQPVTAIPTKGGGRSFAFASGETSIRVTEPAARLLSFVSGELAQKLKTLCGDLFSQLFEERFVCVNNFRMKAFEVLPDKETAQQVIKSVEEPSKATVTIS